MAKDMKSVESWFGLSGTTAVVTGADGLLGRACAKALADCGASVIGVDLKFEKKSESQVVLDVTSPQAITSFFSGLSQLAPGTKRWVFVNCAYPRTENWGKLGFENVTFEDWDANVRMHLGSAFQLTKESVLFMKKNGGGSLLNFGSIYGQRGPDLSIYEGTSIQNPVPYAAIKAGITGLTRYVATAFGDKAIRANVICPGGIENGQPGTFVQAYEDRTPLGRMGTPEDIAGLVAFLAGPSAEYITGQTISVDGGWTAW